MSILLRFYVTANVVGKIFEFGGHLDTVEFVSVNN
jgi:hypothetical protein